MVTEKMRVSANSIINNAADTHATPKSARNDSIGDEV
jgi:hypothetical protein